MTPSGDSKSRPDVDALDRLARERFGLAKEHPLRRRIRSLKCYWDESLYHSILRGLDKLREALAAFPYTSDRIPPDDVFTGDLTLGAVARPDGGETVVKVPSDRLALNMLIVGLIGAGKTYFVRQLIRLLMAVRPDVRILILDPNYSYDTLTKENPSAWIDIDWTDVRTNVLRAPTGYSYDFWRNQAIDLLGRGELLHSRYFLAERLDTLYKRFSVPDVDDGVALVPSLFDLREDLLSKKCKPGSAEERYRQTSLGVLDGRLRATGAVFNCARGMEDALLNARTRISTAGLAPLENVRFFHSHFLHYSYRARLMAPRVEPPRIMDVTVCEEAQPLIEKRDDAPLPLMSELCLRSRSVGHGNIFICQDITHVDYSILSAIGTYVVFSQGNANGKYTCQKMLDLSEKETSILGALPVGTAFVKAVGHEAWPFPFLMKVAK